MKGRTTKRQRTAFGVRLSTIRRECGLTQAALASLLKVDRSLIRYYEMDAKNPKMEFVGRCAAALGVPVEVLWGNLAKRTLAARGPADALNRFYWSLRKLPPERLQFVLRLFSRQLAELRKERR
jgi:transcriptional regulator with XRE-family HTH domain